MIYHITTQSEWQKNTKEKNFSADSLKSEGFIHCSDHYQLEDTANRLFANTPDLLVLEIDPDKLESSLVYENLEGGEMLFPHIYGPLNLDAVISTFQFDHGKNGRLELPEGQKQPEPELLTEFLFGTPGKVYRSPTPGSRMFDPDDQVLSLYKEKGISTVVVLNFEEEHQRHSGRNLLDLYRQFGYHVIYAPVPDFSTPEKGAWDQTLAETIDAIKNGENTVIHCHAGIGRTGMFVAMLAHEILALNSEDAIAWVRNYVPYAIDTHYQKSAVEDYINKNSTH